MIIEIKVPSPGESITEVELASWLVADGETVSKGQEIAEIDSDKATISINAEAAGVIHIKIKEGEKVLVNTIIATIDTEEATEEQKSTPSTEKKNQAHENIKKTFSHLHITPLAQSILTTNNLDTNNLKTISEKKIQKKDVLNALNKEQYESLNDRPVEIIKMSSLRKKISERLVAVKNQTAMLTTFNEIDMSAILGIREKYKDNFQKKHGVKLGFMSFFAKASEIAMNDFPGINASTDNESISYYKYFDLSVAVSTPKGLMTPVIRDIQKLSIPEIEIKISELAIKARENKITIDELTGGTFTITNGGVFGSLMSTPILNPPQSAILGLHKIIDRPVVINKNIEIRPMMYVALSYDHRVIDGKDSVGFIVKLKEILENPVDILFNNDLSKILLR
jgi:2-oxoglutarate dehydrogenase E2 component (dihydrolipoamide succinyltransferase)